MGAAIGIAVDARCRVFGEPRLMTLVRRSVVSQEISTRRGTRHFHATETCGRAPDRDPGRPRCGDRLRPPSLEGHPSPVVDAVFTRRRQGLSDPGSWPRAGQGRRGAGDARGGPPSQADDPAHQHGDRHGEQDPGDEQLHGHRPLTSAPHPDRTLRSVIGFPAVFLKGAPRIRPRGASSHPPRAYAFGVNTAMPI